jgi:hypothetical protein
LSKALKNAPHLQNGIIPAQPRANGLLVRGQPGAQRFQTDAVQASQLGDGVGFYSCLIRSTHNIPLVFYNGLSSKSSTNLAKIFSKIAQKKCSFYPQQYWPWIPRAYKLQTN